MRNIPVAIAILGLAAAAGCGSSPTAAPGVCGGQAADLQTDTSNCGTCGNVCPAPLHASAACSAGVCGRGACDPGWFDVEVSVPGCESGGEGVTAAPLPKTGLVFQAFASGSSYGDRVQVGTTHTNVGALGESTPPAVKDSKGWIFEESVDGKHKNVSGLNAVLW